MTTKDKIISYIKNPFLIIPFLGFRGFFHWIPDALWLKIVFRIKMGYKLDLNNPKTFNEKLQWLKLHDRNPLYTTLVDKYEVRKYITETNKCLTRYLFTFDFMKNSQTKLIICK